MNELARAFLKKASEDAGLRARLEALSGLSAGELAEKAAAVAREAGFDLTPEDLSPAGAELDEDELDAVAGGSGDETCEESGRLTCTCPYEGWGEVLHDGWTSEAYCDWFGF